MSEQIQRREITEEVRVSYLDYAMSVIVARALPDVRDGFKPVHRRILFAMHEMGLRPGGRFRKSAAVIGEVLGKYHPHGDLSVYDAVARLTQIWSMRYPLITGQGNFGCFTKDTKVKLVDGRSVSFEELISEQEAGKRHWTFSFNHEEQRIEIAEITKPRRTRIQSSLVEVTLDNGAHIRCTPDHRFMLRDGVYREAQYMNAGDSLMPLYTRVANTGNAQAFQPIKMTWDHVRRLVDDWNQDNRVREHATCASANVWNTKEQMCGERHYNHKVVSVRALQEKEDVYDITVDPSHNFALDAGVFVHNSIDGDSPAAMRYTEAKMAPLAEEMLRDIEKETVNYVGNYDNTRREPSVLPSAFPNLLVNGTVGIAVGMATNIPPHNLVEIIDALVHLSKDPDATIEDLLKYVKGPDFPTGGTIFNKKDIAAAYVSGKGPIVVRAKAEVQEEKENDFRIVVTEIPFQVNKASILIQIAKLVREKRIEGIRDLRDESGKEGIRIVVELKRDAYPQKILNQLYLHTSLQQAFHMNMLALVDGIQPKVLNLKAVLEYYLEHRKVVVRRRSEYDLRRAKERAHILEGLKKALDHIDKIIEVIKKSPDKVQAHERLMKQFKLSDKQSTAILEMRLQTLSGLERKKVEDELKEKRKLIAELEALLSSPKKILGVVIDELLELKERYGDKRRTQVVASAVGEMKPEDLVPDEDTVLTVTKGGYVKRLPVDTYRVQRRGGRGVIGMTTKEEDAVDTLIVTRSHATILFFTNTGKVFTTKAYELPAGSRTAKGQALQNFLSLHAEERVTSVLALPKGHKAKYLLMATQHGTVKRVAIDDFLNVRNSGLIAIRLLDGDQLEWVAPTRGSDDVMLVTSHGQAVRFKETDTRPMGRPAAGVRGIRLKGDDLVIGMAIIPQELSNAEAHLLVLTERGFGKRTALSAYAVQHRGGSGVKTAKVTEKTGAVVGMTLVPSSEKESSIIVTSVRGQVIRVPLDGISVLGRTTQGVRVMRMGTDDTVATFTLFANVDRQTE